ncbi:MAG: flavoprotein [Pseudonocardiaceae bacterium]|nr:flavoprotein [Pseudonocardiaceae bacterium]
MLGVIGSGAGGVEQLRAELVEPAQQRGWNVVLTLTPTAASWLEESGELVKLEAAVELPVRVQPRMPDEKSPHPPVACYVVAPASANTVAKLALGLMDNQALTTVCEAIGGQVVPVVVFPRVNAAHARQPAWQRHIDALRAAGVHLVYGDDVWPLAEPRQAPPGRPLPWTAILAAADRAVTSANAR